MKNKEIVLTDAELSEGYMIPEKLTKAQKSAADAQLTEALKKSRAGMSEETVVGLKLYQLKFQLEDYLKQETFNTTRTFGYFLKEYLHILNIKRVDFADAIQIHETELSNLIANRRLPSDEIMYRLEIQSDNLFPAVYWHKLVDKQKEYAIATNLELKKKQIRFVNKAFIISANGVRTIQNTKIALKRDERHKGLSKNAILKGKPKIHVKAPASNQPDRAKVTR